MNVCFFLSADVDLKFSLLPLHSLTPHQPTHTHTHTQTSTQMREHTTVWHLQPPVMQWVVGVTAGSGVLAEHLAYHITAGTRPSTQQQTVSIYLSGTGIEVGENSTDLTYCCN